MLIRQSDHHKMSQLVCMSNYQDGTSCVHRRPRRCYQVPPYHVVRFERAAELKVHQAWVARAQRRSGAPCPAAKDFHSSTIHST